MRIDFFTEVQESTAAERYLSNFSSEEIFDEWSYNGPPPSWWDKVVPEFRALYNDFGPMVLVTHKIKNYLIWAKKTMIISYKSLEER